MQRAIKTAKTRFGSMLRATLSKLGEAIIVTFASANCGMVMAELSQE